VLETGLDSVDLVTSSSRRPAACADYSRVRQSFCTPGSKQHSDTLSILFRLTDKTRTTRTHLSHARTHARTHAHTHTHTLTHETVSGSDISWAVCKSAPRSRQTTTPAPQHSVFLQTGCPCYCQTNSVKALKANRSHL